MQTRAYWLTVKNTLVSILFLYILFCFYVSQTSEIRRPAQTFCYITLCYMFQFARTIIRHFLLQQLEKKHKYTSAWNCSLTESRLRGLIILKVNKKSTIYSSLYAINHAANYTCFVTKVANSYKLCALSFGIFLFFISLFTLLPTVQPAIQ